MRTQQGLRRSPIKRGSGSRRQRTVYGVQIRGKPCAYCGAAAVNGDHVVPRSLVRRYNATAPEGAPSIPAKWLEVVPACFACNLLKATRRLVPPSWRDQVAALNRFFGGAKWRVWNGDPKHPSYAEVWK